MRTILVALTALALLAGAPAVALAHHDDPPPDCLEKVLPDCEAGDIFQTCEMRIPPRCEHR